MPNQTLTKTKIPIIKSKIQQTSKIKTNNSSTKLFNLLNKEEDCKNILSDLNQNIDQNFLPNLVKEDKLKNQNKKQNKNNNFFSLQQEYKIVEQIITKFEDFRKVTFYGGANIAIDSKDYLAIQKLANSLAKLDFVVASGGGPGIMAAAISGGNGEFGSEFVQKNDEKNIRILQKKITKNQLQNKAQNQISTLGLRMNLVSEPPPFLATSDYLFTNFAPRKLALRNSQILIFAPGGFGTLDELMEILTLLKTKKMSNKQVFLYNSNFWSGLLSWICREIMATNLAASEFLQYFVVCDQASEILEMIKNPDIYKAKCEQNSCFLR